MSVKVSCSEIQTLTTRLAQLGGNVPKAITIGMYKWAEKTRTAAIEVTPKHLGELRDSIRVPLPDADDCKISIEAGGLAAPYAVIQHEKLFDNYTTEGTGPKYLENPINERMPLLKESIANEIEREIQKVKL